MFLPYHHSYTGSTLFYGTETEISASNTILSKPGYSVAKPFNKLENILIHIVILSETISSTSPVLTSERHTL